MELHTLTIDNIASIRHAEIDFTAQPLAGEPVFLICGETGAGKSTILDAICLALYNEAPRLASAKAEKITDDAIPAEKRSESDSITIGDTRQFLRKGAGEGSSVLTFSGADGQEYKAAWSVSRAYGKADGKLKEVSWTLEWGDNMLCAKKEVRAKIEAVTGMTFNQYCRTTMLAQGEFSKFLKSPENEKADILEKLTRTDIYARIGMKIARKTKEEKERYLFQQQMVKTISVMTPEEKAGLQEKKVELRSRLEEESRIKKEYDEKLKYIEEKAGLEQELVKYIRERDTNGNEFLSLSEDIRTRKAEIAGKTASAEQLKKTLEAASKDEEMFASVKSIKSNLSQVLVDTASKKELKDKIAQNLKSVSMAKKQVEEKNSGIDSMTDGRDKIKAEIAGLDKIIKEKDKNRILEENIEAEKKKSAIREAGSAVRDYLERVSGLEAEKKELDRLGKTMEKSQADWEEKKKISDAAARKYEDAERLFNKMKESAEDWARMTRSRLQAGDICPVCGQTVTSVLSDEAFDAMLKPVADRYTEAERVKNASRQDTDNAEIAFRSSSETFREEERRVSDMTLKVQESRRKAEEQCVGFAVSPDEEGLLERLRILWNDADRKSKELKSGLDEITGLEKKKDALQAEADRIDKDIRSSANEAEKLRSRTGELEKESVQLLERENALEKSVKSLMKRTGELISRKDWNERFAENPEGFIRGLEEEATSYFKGKEMLAKQVEEIQSLSGIISRAEAVRSRIAPNYDAVTVSSAPAVSVRVDWNRLEQIWTDLLYKTGTTDKSIKLTENKIRDIGQMLEKMLDKNDSPEELKKKSAASEEAVNTLNQEIGKIEMMLNKDMENQEKADKEKKKASVYEEEYRKWESLGVIFGDAEGKKFKKIAQSFILSDLIRNANTYLSRLSERYVLDNQSGSLTITVRDMYQGGAERSVNTLSGGETFLVSLSLALGLSSLSKNTMQVGTLFIDEGFGTLSEDYLNTVMEALENLHQTGGKKVGIISHVEALRDRIPVKIMVTRQGNGTSRVEVRRD